ncbi:hypothetical protein H6G33_36265 [Calothrix sp. FACHB-1219]|nr:MULTISPECIES: hypothetical protein [unclassified Calothrix]MBD2207767.1 hypothetical protein [Calothrix sp. FACHB-168]MBD2222387.1 hypothetical protein [Calothrix sp. FACHB-1219]
MSADIGNISGVFFQIKHSNVEATKLTLKEFEELLVVGIYLDFLLNQPVK